MFSMVTLFMRKPRLRGSRREALDGRRGIFVCGHGKVAHALDFQH